MNNTQTLNRNFEANDLGSLFIWRGLTEMAKFLRDGTGTIGIDLILLGLNAAGYFSGIPAIGFRPP